MKNRALSGFSLMELMVVLAIIGILSFLVIPSIGSLVQARGTTSAADQISSSIELARDTAINRNTYVWVGFQPEINSGSLDLRVGMAYSKDGSVDNSTTNLQQINKALLIKGVGLAALTSINVGTSVAGVVDLASVSGGVKLQIGITQFTDKRTITITPRGEVMVNPAPDANTGFDAQIGLGLQPTRGMKLMSNNDIAIIIDGS